MSDFGRSPVGSTVLPCPLAARPPAEVHFIAIRMLDEADQPVAGLAYTVKLPNGDVASGYLDDDGAARIDNIPVGGRCQIGFPDLDQDVWDVIAG